MALHEQVGCVRAQVESPQGRKPMGRGGKKATLEALFAALRPHGLCPRTWNRRPTPSVARGHALKKMMIIIFTFIKKRDVP